MTPYGIPMVDFSTVGEIFGETWVDQTTPSQYRSWLGSCGSSYHPAGCCVIGSTLPRVEKGPEPPKPSGRSGLDIPLESIDVVVDQAPDNAPSQKAGQRQVVANGQVERHLGLATASTSERVRGVLTCLQSTLDQAPAHAIIGMLVGQRVVVLPDRRGCREVSHRGCAVGVLLQDLGLEDVWDPFRLALDVPDRGQDPLHRCGNDNRLRCMVGRHGLLLGKPVMRHWPRFVRAGPGPRRRRVRASQRPAPWRRRL